VCAQRPHSDMESSTHDRYPVPPNTHVILERDVRAAVHSQAVVCERNYHIDLDAEGDRRMDAPWLCTELFCMMTLLAFEIPKPSVLCPGFIGRELGFVYD
jgi:hypothetical protein